MSTRSVLQVIAPRRPGAEGQRLGPEEFGPTPPHQPPRRASTRFQAALPAGQGGDISGSSWAIKGPWEPNLKAYCNSLQTFLHTVQS